jgi:hypothetical protein
MLRKTISERLVEGWLDRHKIEWRRIRVAITPGHRRPEYAIRVGGHRCVIEVKELTPSAEDKQLIEDARAGIIEARWVAPGKRLRPLIRSVEKQLRKFSSRGFATIACLQLSERRNDSALHTGPAREVHRSAAGRRPHADRTSGFTA